MTNERLRRSGLRGQAGDEIGNRERHAVTLALERRLDRKGELTMKHRVGVRRLMDSFTPRQLLLE